MLANMNQDCREFNNAQAAACQCLSPEKAVLKREKTLKGACAFVFNLKHMYLKRVLFKSFFFIQFSISLCML
jgi:hypothetical protein